MLKKGSYARGKGRGDDAYQSGLRQTLADTHAHKSDNLIASSTLSYVIEYFA